MAKKRVQIHRVRGPRPIFELAQIAPRRFGGEQDILAEAQRPVGMDGVEGDDVREGPNLGLGGPVAQIEVEVALQLVDEDDLAINDIALGLAFRVAAENSHEGSGPAGDAGLRDVVADNRRAAILKEGDRVAHHGGGARRQRFVEDVAAGIGRVGGNTDAGAS